MKQEDLDALKSIEAIRAKNNIAWVEILRIALDSDPDATKAVLGRIEVNDRLITHLTYTIANS